MERFKFFQSLRRRKVRLQTSSRDTVYNLTAGEDRRTENIIFTVKGYDLLVYPGVFPPTTDTFLLADHLHNLSKKRILDLTTGSGVHAVMAGLEGATGVAIDINPKAVLNTIENLQRANINGITAFQSDLYEHVPPEKFDLVVCNPPPYSAASGVILRNKPELFYGIHGGLELKEKILQGLKAYLSPTGRALITDADFAMDGKLFENLINTYGFNYEIIDTRKSRDGKRKYNLYEIKSMVPK